MWSIPLHFRFGVHILHSSWPHPSIPNFFFHSDSHPCFRFPFGSGFVSSSTRGRRMLSHVRVVLVSPRTSENVAAAARACEAFECDDLRLVRPRCRHRDDAHLSSVSRDASSWQRLRVHEDLHEAIRDTTFAVAYTRRAGGMCPHLHVADARATLPWRTRTSPSSLALVFGREESGLNDVEVMACTHGCYLPTGSRQGSLNLSHAVCVALSDEFRHVVTCHEGATRPFGRTRTHRQARLEEKEAWLRRLDEAMKHTDGQPHERKRRLRHVERWMKRSDVDVQELQALHGILTGLTAHHVPPMQGDVPNQH
mmetsp:Transcript_9827/g.59800  ORF Transcript_9827/g.59800 Transcript_9827/m.59800 type:complete len:310 (+) Transcript_9827:2218-3147(+)